MARFTFCAERGLELEGCAPAAPAPLYPKDVGVQRVWRGWSKHKCQSRGGRGAGSSDGRDWRTALVACVYFSISLLNTARKNKGRGTVWVRRF